MVTDPNVAVLLRGYMRVIRGKVTIDHLTAIFPTLSQRSISNLLTGTDRRLLLDLPDEDEEIANIAKVSIRTKAELFAQVLEDPALLSDDELGLFKDNFWSDITTAEVDQRAEPTCILLDQGLEEALGPAFDTIKAIRDSAYLPNESAAIDSAYRELMRRSLVKFKADRIRDAGGQERLDRAKPWVRKLHDRMADDQEGSLWGYVCYLDAYTRALPQEQLESIWCRMDMFLRRVQDANTTNGGPAFGRWYIQYIKDGPPCKPLREDGTVDTNAIAAFHDHFSSILDQPPKCRYPMLGDVAGAGPAHGLLRNTFLVFDNNACDSITTPPSYPDDLRILAVEHPFQPSPTSQLASLRIAESATSLTIDEYAGVSFVRITQLPHNFYEQRWLHGDEAGNFKLIWKAARRSRNEAFVSLDGKEFGAYKNSMDTFSAVEMVPWK